MLLFKDRDSSIPFAIIRVSDALKIFGFARAFCPFLIPTPFSFQHLDHHARSIGSLNGKKTRGRLKSGEDGRKRVPEKRCLRLGHQKLFHGGDSPRSIPVRKGFLFLSPSLSVFLSLVLFPFLLPLPLSLSLPPSLPPSLFVPLSSALPHENP